MMQMARLPYNSGLVRLDSDNFAFLSFAENRVAREQDSGSGDCVRRPTLPKTKWVAVKGGLNAGYFSAFLRGKSSRCRLRLNVNVIGRICTSAESSVFSAGLNSANVLDDMGSWPLEL